MLLSLAQWLQSHYPDSLGFLRVFQYLTFRAVMAAMTALLIGLLLGPWVIRKLAELKIGQPVRGYGMQLVTAAQLFAADGTIELGVDGVYAGPARIEEYLRRLHGGQEGLIYGQLNEWVTLQPAIVVADDARSATARWRDLGMLGQYHQHAEWRAILARHEVAQLPTRQLADSRRL